MKTTIKKYLVVVLMFGALISYANENNTPVNPIDAKRVKVEFNAVKKGNTLSIKEINGFVLYSSKIESAGILSKTFDFSALKSGSYVAELNKDYEVIKKYFKVLNGKVSFEEDEKFYKPSIRVEEDLVFISKISFDKKPVQIAVYYNNEVIFSETTKTNKDLLNRIYRVSKEIKGNYKVQVNSDGRTFTKHFKI
ncbi:hypothetical protein JL193_10630 [Polaribacter batillariae]|uniref:Por secretion system C-terminal sorting domain-containing protein n=1 Tax=Polaribacter batillariae TaxID=2808900 RepID=A0ABX7SUS5_9FLAO|nr:hypothetical protein [Polaribacter batillariae]QTD36598.1 hypothetical protein JL193_10630 [Polaribacter batillariae]